MSVNSTPTLASVEQAIKGILLGGQAISGAGMT